MSNVLKLTVPGMPEYIQTVKMAVGSAASINGFDFEKVEDIKMAVGEACKNVTCHAHDCWCKNYQIECDFGEEHVVVKLLDKKSDHNVSKGNRPCIDCPNEGDLGMEIVKSLVNDFEIIADEEESRTIKMVISKC